MFDHFSEHFLSLNYCKRGSVSVSRGSHNRGPHTGELTTKMLEDINPKKSRCQQDTLL